MKLKYNNVFYVSLGLALSCIGGGVINSRDEKGNKVKGSWTNCYLGGGPNIENSIYINTGSYQGFLKSSSGYKGGFILLNDSHLR